MNYGLGRRISFHEEVEFVPIQEFSSTALVEPFEEDTCSRKDKPRDTTWPVIKKPSRARAR